MKQITITLSKHCKKIVFYNGEILMCSVKIILSLLTSIAHTSQSGRI